MVLHTNGGKWPNIYLQIPKFHRNGVPHMLDDDHISVPLKIKPLFTSVPMGLAVDAFKAVLQAGEGLSKHTAIKAHSFVRLLQFCLENTLFSQWGAQVCPWEHHGLIEIVPVKGSILKPLHTLNKIIYYNCGHWIKMHKVQLVACT